MTGVAEILMGLLLAVAVLALVARKLTIPYPILFVVGGLLLGLIPKLPQVRLDPELVFLFVLPPLAVVTGSFSLTHASVQFFVVGIGGILVGLAVGWLAEQFHKRVDDAPIEITVSLLTPFVAYLAAERFGFSGVLAVVTAGLYLGMRMPELLSFRTRLRGGPVWEMVEFLLNGFVFILIGLQLPEVVSALSGHSIPVQRLVWQPSG